MRTRLFTLTVMLVLLHVGAYASKLFIPMDATGQSDHLKAYGVAFSALQQGEKVQWLLNYRGGSFAMEYDKNIEAICRTAHVSFVRMSNKQYAAVVKEINAPSFNGKIVELEKAPRIAVYTPPGKKPWDDAVTLALTYAGIPFDKIYAEDVLSGALDKYDWLHLHHEDFTGQYGKFYPQFHNADWYKNEVATMETIAARHGFKKVSQVQLAVVKKMKDFVASGGNLFAMCSATETFDIALSAEGVDICDKVYDGDDADVNAQDKLNYANCLAFKDFKVIVDPNEYGHSTIDNTGFRMIPSGLDYFKLHIAPAKFDPVPAMLCQDHTTSVPGFMGQTTAFRKSNLKPGVQVLGDCPQAAEARYIHGELGNGSWTFLGGHDPEDYAHLVGNKPTDLALFPNSAGYRLILNNVLFPAAKKIIVPMVIIAKNESNAVASTENVVVTNEIKMQPNPTNGELTISSSVAVSLVAIIDMNGREVYSKHYNATQVQIDTKDLAPGMYLVKVNGEYAGKLVKE